MSRKHALAGSGELDQPQGDVALQRRRLAAALAGIFELGAGPRPAQDVGIDQRVIDDDVAVLHGVVAQERHEARRAGAGADQPDPARLENRERLSDRAAQSRARAAVPVQLSKFRFGIKSSRSLVLLTRASYTSAP